MYPVCTDDKNSIIVLKHSTLNMMPSTRNGQIRCEIRNDSDQASVVGVALLNKLLKRLGHEVPLVWRFDGKVQ